MSNTPKIGHRIQQKQEVLQPMKLKQLFYSLVKKKPAPGPCSAKGKLQQTFIPFHYLRFQEKKSSLAIFITRSVTHETRIKP